ncbi:hypothetical protein [Xanthomonas translucens]|nr:hypothetical protein [Xanthomonas translucens]MCS3361874.1 hypothetical protein [Xanthomonas translucens pv. translucens]MCS3375422.1 hypothetical protein [Xanthomonas translucens pv. translucens]MCT8276458.1 hypothetical protein [Xanthomonas translucens pv. translucens]MCT8280248.1 hypothetical protein [Xanthomonas translucens pv. translucens]MCT8291416.1 hypothetical protein [Xanthomonas translucens pv. translucens]
MSARKLAVLAVFVVIGMVAAVWLGVEHRDDVRAFLRALARAL